MLGRESAGVPGAVHDRADLRVRIPLRPGLRSLNVAMAAAIVLGEALRQTGGFAEASPMSADASREQETARAWFEQLRDRICAAFEAIEDDYAGPAHATSPPGRFERQPWAAAGAAAAAAT